MKRPEMKRPERVWIILLTELLAQILGAKELAHAKQVAKHGVNEVLEHDDLLDLDHETRMSWRKAVIDGEDDE